MKNSLVGIWKSDTTDLVTKQLYGNISMEFRDNGELIYRIVEAHKEQIILLTYQIDGPFLVTDQPSHPGKISTEYVVDNNVLYLNFKGDRSKFLKIE